MEEIGGNFVVSKQFRSAAGQCSDRQENSTQGELSLLCAVFLFNVHDNKADERPAPKSYQAGE